MSNPSNSGSTHSLGAGVEKLRGKWAAIAAFGVLLMLLGAASLVFAFVSTLAMVTVNGVFFVIAGGAEIGIGMHSKGWGRFFLWVAGGVLYIVAGLACILTPLAAATILTLIVGAGLIAAAVVRVYLAFELPAGRPRAPVFVAAAVTLLLGLIIVMSWPLSSLYVLGTLLGVDLLFHGAAWASFGVGLRAR